MGRKEANTRRVAQWTWAHTGLKALVTAAAAAAVWKREHLVAVVGLLLLVLIRPHFTTAGTA